MKFASVAIRTAVTVSLIYWLLARADANVIIKTLATLHPVSFAAAVLLHAVVFVLGSLRWWILLRHTQAHVSYSRVWPAYYLGIFFNNFLPTTMGGDAVRILRLRLEGLNTNALISSSLIDRAIGLFVMVPMGTLALMIYPALDVKFSEKIYLFAACVAFALTAGAMFSRPVIEFINRQSGKLRRTRIRRRLLELVSVCQSYRRAGSRLLVALALTVIAQSVIVLIYYLLGRTLGIALPAVAYFTMVPAISVLTTIPVSIGGLGLREGALVALLLALSVPNQLAVALSLAYLLVLWLVSLPGGLLLLGRSHKKVERPLELR